MHFTKDQARLFLLLALGAQTLVVELTIPRLIAPAFGNTLFSWTAIIAVVLISLTAGYWYGGKLAARSNGERYIVLFSLAAAVWVLILSIVGESVVDRLSFLNMMFGPLVAAAVLAGSPALLDAAVVPLVIQTRNEQSGEASGRCFAWSTVGSIMGVLATGYVLLPQLGIAGSLIAGAALVILATLLVRSYAFAAIGACLVAVAVTVSLKQSSSYLYDASNGYHRLRVSEDSERQRFLYLDNTLEGAIQRGSPEPVVVYQKKLSDILEGIGQLDSVLILGGGAFTIPRYIKFLRPDTEVDVAEIDPLVVEVGERFMELTDDVAVHIGDGRQVLKHSKRKYDLIVNDAFQGLRKIPFHLTTSQFNALVAERLSPNGIYLVNVRGDPARSDLAASMIRTLREHFEHLTAVPATRTNTWVLASQTTLDSGSPIDQEPGRGRLLTDDHAPIEYLIVKDIVQAKLGTL